MKSRSMAVIGILLFASALASTAIAETRTLSWDPVTTYTDGTSIEPWKTVKYTVYWSNDPWLAADTLRILVSSTTAKSATFDPATEKMSDYNKIYFSVKSVVSTGEESAFSDVLPWDPPPATVSPGVPMAPANFGIASISTFSPGGTWELSWDSVTKNTDGTAIDASTVRYTVFWSTDAGLSPASLSTLASSIAATSFAFDAASLGLQKNQRVYFTARTVLTTGMESALSASLAWRASNKGPGAPGNGRLVGKNK